MTTDNKKIMIYVGGALVVGAVSFFIYSFFKKGVPVSNSNLTFGKKDKATTQTTTADGASAFNIGQQVDFGDITAPNVLGKKYTVTDINGLS